MTETTEWIDRSLIGLNELVLRQIILDEWERAYADMMEDLDIDADQTSRQNVGREALAQASRLDGGGSPQPLYGYLLRARQATRVR